MSTPERNRYTSPPGGFSGEGTSASTAVGPRTFETAPRFATPPGVTGRTFRARGNAAYPTTQTPGRQRGYADMFVARAQNEADDSPSNILGTTGLSDSAWSDFNVSERLALSPQPRPSGQPVAVSPPAAFPRPFARRNTITVGTDISNMRQPSPSNGNRTLATVTAKTPPRRSPNGPRQYTPNRSPKQAPAATQRWSHVVTNPIAAPDYPPPDARTATAQAPAHHPATRGPPRRIDYEPKTPLSTPVAPLHEATSPTLPLVLDAHRQHVAMWPTRAHASGRFQDPGGDDWLGGRDRAPMDFLQELESIIGALTRLSSQAPGSVEAGAPPRQLPADLPIATSVTTELNTSVPVTVSAAAAARTGEGNFEANGGHRSVESAVEVQAGVVQSANNGQEPGSSAATMESRHTSAAPRVAMGPDLHRPPISFPIQSITLSTLLSTLQSLGEDWNAVQGASTSIPNNITTATPPMVNLTPIATGYTATGATAEPFQQSSVSEQGTATPAASGRVGNLQASDSHHSAATKAASATATASLPGALSLSPSVIMDMWGALQACNQTTSRLVADLAAARREAESAKERADEADSLARVYQQQLLSRQQAVTAWQDALVEMEERETSTREQLQELQTRCREQAQRAQQAEHVAATAQLRLERLMAAQAEVPRAATGGEGPPPPQLQQHLEALQVDLAAAKTRATRAELELAVARNKALMAQQELSKEEERARRGAAAAEAARQELGRTRLALVRMGTNHDRLRSQLVGLRDQVEDAARSEYTARGATGPSRNAISRQRSNLSATLHQPAEPALLQHQNPPPELPQQQQQRSPPAPRPASPRMQTPSGGAVTQRQGSQALPRSHSTREGARPHFPAASQPRGAAAHVLQRAEPSSGDIGPLPRVIFGPVGIGKVVAVQSRSSSNGSSNGGAGRGRSGSSSPIRRSGGRGGSLLLVPPGEIRSDTTASVRYVHCAPVRRRSRSENAGVVDSPSGGDTDEFYRPMNLSGGLALADSGQAWSPRAVSGSCNSGARRLSVDVLDRKGRCGVGPENSGDGSGSTTNPGGGGSGDHPLSSGLPNEMLSLKRTPSSAIRRRAPSLVTSQGSVTGEPASSSSSSANMTKPHLTVSHSQTSVEPATAAVGAAVPIWSRKAYAAATAHISGGVEKTPQNQCPPHLPEQQQQRRSERQGSANVSLADLRKQLAAAAAAGTAPEEYLAAQRQRASAQGLAARAQTTPPVAATTTMAASAATATSTAAPAADSRELTSRSQPEPEIPRLPTFQSQPMPASLPATPLTSKQSRSHSPSSALNGSTSKTRRSPREPLPRLEPSSSPPERPERITAGDAILTVGHCPTLPVLEQTPGQPGQRFSVVKTANLLGDRADATAAAPGTHLVSVPSYVGRQTSVVALRSRMVGPSAIDTQPPHGYSSHINDLYESTTFGSIVQALPLAPAFHFPPSQELTPRSLTPLPDRVAEAVAAPRGVSAQAAQVTRAGVLPTAAIAPWEEPPGRRSSSSAPDCSGPPQQPKQQHLALTPRSRILNPDQLSSFLISCSVSNSVVAAVKPEAAEASSHLLAHSQLQHPHRLASPQQSGHSGTGSPGSAAVDRGGAAVQALPLPSGAAVQALPLPSDARLKSRPCTPIPPLSTRRRPWWLGWIPRQLPRLWMPRPEPGIPLAPRKIIPATSTSSTSSPRPHGRALVSDQPMGLSAGSDPTLVVEGSRSGMAAQRAAATAVDNDGNHPSPRGSNSKAGARGCKLRSVLLHFGMWSGGTVVGVLLVLGLAGLVEGTLGVGVENGTSPGTSGSYGSACICPGQVALKSPDVENSRGKGPSEEVWESGFGQSKPVQRLLVA